MENFFLINGSLKSGLDEKLFNNIIEFLKIQLKDYDSSHDIFHATRVWKLAIKIAWSELKSYNYKISMSVELIELTALFHDVIDDKYNSNLEVVKRTEEISNFLKQNNIDKNTIDHMFCNYKKNVFSLSIGKKK